MTALPADQLAPIARRLKRAHGHLAHVIALIESGADCEEVLTQLAAVNKAVTRSGFALVATGMQHCRPAGQPDAEGMDPARLEKLFLSLA